MKVHIEGKLYVESDDRQYIIKSYSGKFDDKGNEGFKALAYYGTLQGVVKYLISMKVKESTASNLNELITDIRRIEKWVHDLVGEV